MMVIRIIADIFRSFISDNIDSISLYCLLRGKYR